MEGFKKIVKMKTGGSVSKAVAAYEKKEEKAEMKEDVAQDKAIVKKGVRQHEAALHKGEPKTELKLKCGGRAKKATGTVKKYKTGGTVENAYGAKKTDKDIKDIANSKRQKPVKLCGGKSVSKYEEGGIVDTIKAAGKDLYEKVIGTPEQNRIAQESMDRQAKAGSKLAKFFGGRADAPSAPENQSEGAFNKKRGGKICK